MWYLVTPVAALGSGGRKLCEIEGQRLAVLEFAGEFVVIDNHCPHRGGPIGAGTISANTITCPWHGLAFDLTSGECSDRSVDCLRRYPTKIEDGQLWVDLTPAAEASEDIHRYLVRYGVPGHVGRFGSIEPVTCSRGDRVLVSTDRGQEAGEILVTASDLASKDHKRPAGELLRILSEPDDAMLAELRAQAADILQLVRDYIAVNQSDTFVLDAELTFDNETCILYHAGEATEALGRLAVKLSELAGGRRVQFESWQPAIANNVASAAAPPNNIPDGIDAMRGPHERLKYDFRRVWECPLCHHRQRTPGSVTSQFCQCQAKVEPIKQVPMKLVDDGPRRVDGQVTPPRKSTLP